MNFIKSLPFHLLWLVLVNCLFLSKVVLSESPSSENDVLPVNGYGLTILDNTNSIENPDLNRGFDLINALDNYAVAQRKLEQQRRLRQIARAFNQKYSQFNKRNCLLNVGSAHSTCDFKELVNAVNARKFWESASGPGKRRKRSFFEKTN